MRLRNITGSKEYIRDSDFVVHNPEELKGLWASNYFKNNNPVRIEIGMGKGRFITRLAEENPDINYIGIEKYSSVLLRAIQKLEAMEEPLKNLALIRFDADFITNIFGKDEIDRIYLNFSDPWPKDRYAKRRLTSDRFLKRYEQFLINGHEIEFKTDNVELFDFSLESVKETGLMLVDYTYDLHNDDRLNKGNIMTEYEERFSKCGNKICKCIIKMEKV